MSIGDRLQKMGAKAPMTRSGPVWKGPEEDGITFSLLSRFLNCRERFRLLVVEGLRAADQFNHRIEYGNMWHVCEESFAGREKLPDNPAAKVLGDSLWHARLLDYCKGLCKRYPLAQEQIDHWYNVCKVQFPLYVDYWREHPDVSNRTPLLQEETFNIPYKLPSGRVVKLRGKWDSVDLITEGKSNGIYLQENKTKGDIDETGIARQLSFDLQTMLYLIALREPVPGSIHAKVSTPILGVRYNVIRRPLSGGAGTIRQHKPTKSNPRGESREEFYARLSGIIQEDPAHYFMRWKVGVGSQDIKRFRTRCLDPILEQLCDWWSWITQPGDDIRNCIGPHWQHPFGVYNVLNEGGYMELDEYLATGSEIGLQRTDNLFPELS